MFINIELLIGVMLGIGLFGDLVSWLLLLGGMLIVIGSVVVVCGECVDISYVVNVMYGLLLG